MSVSLPRRALSTLLLLSVLAAPAYSGECHVPRTGVASATDAERVAVEAVRSRALSPIPLSCVSTETADEQDSKGHLQYRVTFRESHKPECGGDPQTAPRLFTVTVARDGRLSTDANRGDMASGRYRALTCAPARPAASAASR